MSNHTNDSEATPTIIDADLEQVTGGNHGTRPPSTKPCAPPPCNPQPRWGGHGQPWRTQRRDQGPSWPWSWGGWSRFGNR